MKWVVYYHEFNGDKIKVFNIFDHSGFATDVKKYLKKYEVKEEFAEQLRRSLFYYFCSKCEWEILISAWVGSRDSKPIKVDVYEQVMNNWDVFLDYVWNSKRKKVLSGYCPLCDHRIALRLEDESNETNNL